MKALAIDCATSNVFVALKDDKNVISVSCDIKMKQNALLLPIIDFLFSKVDFATTDLDYMALTIGPGSFTGLRLAYATLKALSFSNEKQIYGISTLDAYEHFFKDLPFLKISVIDAKKERFYAKGFFNEEIIFNDGDWETSEIAEKINSFCKKNNYSDKILLCGSDAKLLQEKLLPFIKENEIISMPFFNDVAKSIFSLAEEKIKTGLEPLKDFSGPVYLRKSEAEEKLLTQ